VNGGSFPPGPSSYTGTSSPLQLFVVGAAAMGSGTMTELVFYLLTALSFAVGIWFAANFLFA